MSAPMPQPHDRTRKAEQDEEDPVERMIGRTGCTPFHYAVMDCMAEHQDWRKCQPQVQSFKDCMQDYQKKRAEGLLEKKSQLQGQAS
ncbi:cytochrome c oxidase assembly factor 4 homolog, mitochondrial [Gastrophryne carolinensis]